MLVPEREEGKLLFAIFNSSSESETVYEVKTPFPHMGDVTMSYFASKELPIILSFRENGQFSVQLGSHQTTTCFADQVNEIKDLDPKSVMCAVYYIQQDPDDPDYYKVIIFFENKKRVVTNKEILMKVGGKDEGIIVKNLTEGILVFP